MTCRIPNGQIELFGSIRRGISKRGIKIVGLHKQHDYFIGKQRTLLVETHSDFNMEPDAGYLTICTGINR